MSEANVERAWRIFGRLQAEGVDAVLDEIHPEFHLETPPDLASEPGVYEGRNGIKRWFDSFYEAMDEVAIEPSEIVPAGEDRVGVAFKLVARGRSTGLVVTQDAAMIVTLRENMISRMDVFGTLEEAVTSVRR